MVLCDRPRRLPRPARIRFIVRAGSAKPFAAVLPAGRGNGYARSRIINANRLASQENLASWSGVPNRVAVADATSRPGIAGRIAANDPAKDPAKDRGKVSGSAVAAVLTGAVRGK